MAMDLDNALEEIKTAIKVGMQAAFPMGSAAPTTPEDFQDVADGFAPGIVAALQHILDNAETAVATTPAEGEDHAHGGIL